ncbi:flavin reductase family protein [Microbacterium sp. HJ5]
MACSIEWVLDGGDHHMVLLRIEAYTLDPSIEPPVWYDSGFFGVGTLTTAE